MSTKGNRANYIMAFMQLQKGIKKLLVYFYGPNSKDICIRINRIKDKNHMIVSMDEKKSLTEI